MAQAPTPPSKRQRESYTVLHQMQRAPARYVTKELPMKMTAAWRSNATISGYALALELR